MPVPLLENITFWDRKNTALKVGHGGVTEVLSRLELIRRDKQSTAPSKTSKTGKECIEPSRDDTRTRLVIVGHSFGGALVHSALAQVLQQRFVQTTGCAGVQGDVGGFADLVVLINPATEAMHFSPLSDMATERTYFASQLPVVLQLTSEADSATRYAFPAGRWFSTRFEKTRERQRWNAVTQAPETIDESQANVAAVGHFQPYHTHRLYPRNDRGRAQAQRIPTELAPVQQPPRHEETGDGPQDDGGVVRHRKRRIDHEARDAPCHANGREDDRDVSSGFARVHQ